MSFVWAVFAIIALLHGYEGWTFAFMCLSILTFTTESK